MRRTRQRFGIGDGAIVFRGLSGGEIFAGAAIGRGRLRGDALHGKSAENFSDCFHHDLIGRKSAVLFFDKVRGGDAGQKAK